MKLRTLSAAAVATVSLATALPSLAQDRGDYLVRVRAVHLDPANSDSTGLGLSTNAKWLPELDLTWFATPNFAMELILTVPQGQTLYSNGTKIGTFKHLPPTLTAQYHFTSLPAVRPYVGLGVNYTRLTSVSFEPAVVTALNPSVKRNSWGLAAQVGVDVPLPGGWLANIDVKKAQIGTDVYAGTTKAGTFKVDPWLVGIGLGKRF